MTRIIGENFERALVGLRVAMKGHSGRLLYDMVVSICLPRGERSLTRCPGLVFWSGCGAAELSFDPDVLFIQHR